MSVVVDCIADNTKTKFVAVKSLCSYPARSRRVGSTCEVVHLRPSRPGIERLYREDAMGRTRS